jgi:hypothetical protein
VVCSYARGPSVSAVNRKSYAQSSRKRTSRSDRKLFHLVLTRVLHGTMDSTGGRLTVADPYLV